MLVKQAKVMSKGQITIPASVRDALHLREGDTVASEVYDKATPGSARSGPRALSHATPVPYVRTEAWNAKRIVEALREGRGW